MENTHHIYSSTQKVALCLPCIRQNLFPRRNLLAGPFAGEFGYELMQWQAFVRARKQYYDQVHVLTYPGRDYMYEGCIIHHHNIDLKNAGYGYGHLSRIAAHKMARIKAEELKLESYDIFEPSLLCTQYHKRFFWKQDFRLFQEPSLCELRDVAFHFRSVRKSGHDQAKNYSPELAEHLVRQCIGAGLSLLCIGHPDYSFCPAGAQDCRSVDLKKTIAAICSTRLVVGENSGPSHLANLCGKPTVIFADAQWRIDYSIRWNPFSVPQYIAANETVQPEPGIVLSCILEALADLRQRTDNFAKPSFTIPAHAIAGY